MARIETIIDKYLSEADTEQTQEIMITEGDYDNSFVEQILDFVINVDEDSLTDEQAAQLDEILSTLDVEGEDGVSEVKMLHKTAAKAKKMGILYYKKNKAKIKMARKKIAKKVQRLAKMGKGLSGKKLGMTKYHT